MHPCIGSTWGNIVGQNVPNVLGIVSQSCPTCTPCQAEQRTALEILIEETPKLGQIFCLPTFLIIIGQGVFGTAPWFAFSYITMWLELTCFSNTEAASIWMCFNLGTALSNALGGVLLDVVCRHFPDHGPPAMAQCAVFASIPLFAFIFFGLGQGVHGNLGEASANVMMVYCFTFFMTGTMIASTMMNNNKMMSDVVPRESYTYIYALDRAIEGTIGAFGQPMVGWLADHIFNFDPKRANTLGCSPQDASSLARGIFSVTAAGCTMCWLFYGLAHYTYPKDRQNMLQLAAAKCELVKGSGTSEQENSLSFWAVFSRRIRLFMFVTWCWLKESQRLWHKIVRSTHHALVVAAS